MATSRPKTEGPGGSERPGSCSLAFRGFCGFLTSTIVALGVGAAGGWFEAVALFPLTGVVTLTTMPAIVFLALNSIALRYLARSDDYPDHWFRGGLVIGFVNIVVAMATSFVVFLFFVDMGLLFP